MKEKKVSQTKEKNNLFIMKKRNYSHKQSLKNDKDKYYIPICKEKDCGGNLNITIDEKNFLVNYKCEKNKEHGNLFLDTFEKLYLEERIIQKCCKCSNILEREDKYKCLECNNYYCSSCFLSDKHILTDSKKLKIETNKCPKDKSEIIYYCSNCSENICFYCYKNNEDNPHKEHKIVNILEKMPTNNEINSLKDKVLKKSDAFDSLIKLNEKKIEIKEINFNVKELHYIDYQILENLVDDLLIYNDKNSDYEIKLLKYDKNRNNFSIINQINFPKKIFSLNFSPDKKKIYVCLANKKSINIINYNLINNYLELAEEKIEIDYSRVNFKKCVHINDNCLMAIDNLIIYLWIKQLNSNKYLNIKKLKFTEELYDICKINDENAIFSQKSKISFLNIKKLRLERIIEKIDCIYENNALILINDYILINCKKGIAIISIKTKEMINYIDWPKKGSIRLHNEYIYIFGVAIIYRLKLFENNLKLITKIKINGEGYDTNNIYINDKYTLIWGNAIFELINDNNTNKL